MNKTNLLPFDLEVALKQPDRVAQRGTENPVEWVHFKSVGKVLYYDHENYLKDVKENGAYNSMNIPDYYDLMLLPEFTPEEGKWYWVKQQEFDDYLPRGYARGFFWIHGIRFKKDEVFAIHPEPINPPE